VSLACRGEIRAIIGPTAREVDFFNCLTGVLRPTSGRIVFNGEDIAGLPSHTISRKAIARSYQSPTSAGRHRARERQDRQPVATPNWSMLRHHRSYTDVIASARTALADVASPARRRARGESLARRAAQSRDRHRARHGPEAARLDEPTAG